MKEIQFRGFHLGIMRYDISCSLLNETGHNLNESLIELQRRGVIIMQYIGVKDKNDKKIFEGDVVKFPNDGTHTIEFPCDFLWCETQQREIEVVGNIYEINKD